MNLFKWAPCLCLLLLFQSTAGDGYSSPASKAQEVEYPLRTFDQSQLEELRDRAEYDYSIKRGDGTTLWQRIKLWFLDFIRQLLSSPGTNRAIQIIIYALIIGAAIFSILKFLDTKPSSLFSKSKNQNIPYKVSDENIHEINFESEIDIAIENHDYRLATRLFYLQSLKLLSDLELIHWLPGKTNTEYFYELNVANIKTSFSSLGHMFEYAWYGGFKIDRPIMEKAREYFLVIKSRTQTGVQ